MVVVSVTKLNTLDVASVQKAMESVVEGELVPFNQLSTDWGAVKKVRSALHVLDQDLTPEIYSATS